MDNKKDNNELVMAIAAIIIGGGGLVAVIMLSPVPILELLQAFALTLLPVLCLAGFLGIMSWGSIKLIWNQDLAARVRTKVQELKDAADDISGFDQDSPTHS